MDDHSVDKEQQAVVAARDRPEGQADPESQQPLTLKVSTKAIVLSSAIVGAVVWGFVLATGPSDLTPSLALTLTLAGMSLLTALFPLQVALKQEMSFDLAVIVAAAMLLEPRWSIPVVVVGYALGYGIRYRARFEIDCLFNGAMYAISLGLSGLMVHWLGWNFAPAERTLFEIVGLGASVALVYLAVFRVAVAVVVQSQSRQPWRQILRDSTFGMQVAEQAMLGAMIALGIIGVAIASRSAFGLWLLIVPAFALWLALRQHIETRHRIEASLATAQEVAGIGSLDWDLRRGDIRWSEILFKILGYEPDLDLPSTDAYVHRVQMDDRPRVLAAFQAAAEGREIEIDHRVELPDGQERAFNLKFSGVRDSQKRVKRLVGTIHDVTDRKRLEDRLQFQAFHDPLTQLPNRAMFLQRLDQSFARYARTSAIALLYLDLDRFKVINDTLGHDAGDQLLRTISARLEFCLRPNDIVARLGGDEFIVLLDNVLTLSDAIVVAERIIAAVGEPVSLAESHEVTISTSVGIVRPEPGHKTSADLLRDADTALYQAKLSGRNRYAVFEAAMSADAAERGEIERDLRTAVARNELDLVFQPRFNLTTDRIEMVEAFVRWRHPVRGDVPPDRFIPIAEEAGFSGLIGEWILATAIREAAVWAKLVDRAPTLSVNITARQMLATGFAARVSALVAYANMAPGGLRLEVSESSLMSNQDATVQAVSELKEYGIRVSIDDFGTGHSSLGALRRFPVDMLQLDHQFVAELGKSAEATAIAQAVIGLAHGLGLSVIAEGVETRDQVDLLRALGCELAQGHYFCSPLSAPLVLTFLINHDRMMPVREKG